MGATLWWLIVMVAFFAGEMYTRAFFALFVAIAAAGGALAAAAGAPVALQGIVFVAAAGLGIAALRPPLRRSLTRGQHRLVSGAQGLVGREAVATSRIGGMTEPGKISIQGELWPASTDDPDPVSEGALVLIVELRGSRFIVQQLPEEELS